MENNDIASLVDEIRLMRTVMSDLRNTMQTHQLTSMREIADMRLECTRNLHDATRSIHTDMALFKASLTEVQTRVYVICSGITIIGGAIITTSIRWFGQ